MDKKPMGKFINTNKTAILIAFLITVIIFTGQESPCQHFPQDKTASASKESEMFEKAYSYYLSYQPKKALELFDVFLKDFPLSSATDSVLFWKAKTLIQLKRTGEAKDIFLKIKELYPDSYFYNFAQKELENLDIQIVEVKEVIAEEIPESSDKKTVRQEKNKSPDVGLKDDIILALKKEKEDALAKVNSLEIKASELNLALAKLQESQKDWKKLDIYIKELKDERVKIENQIKDKDKRLAEADKTISKLKGQSSDKTLMLNEIKALEDSRREYEKQITSFKRQTEESAKKHFEEKDSLILKLKDSESTIRANNESLNRLKKDIEKKEMDLKAANEKIQENTNKYKEADLLIKKLSEDKSIAEAKIAELKKPSDDTSKKNKEIVSDLSAVSEWIKQYEKPFVKIANVNYSVLQIIAENIISSRVISKLSNEPVIWRGSSAYENFITEQILFNKAKEIGIKENANVLIPIVKKYAFNDKEKEYLAKYLAIDTFINNKLSARTIDEKEISDYYNANKNNYLIGAEDKIVKTLIINYTVEDEVEKALFAVELRKDAFNGISFESLRKNNPDLVIFKQMKYNELPNWIKDKTQDLKDGELSNVVSVDNQFMIYQIQLKNPKYKKYEDVYDEIRQLLLSKKTYQFSDLNKWLKEIRKEAEEIR